MPLKSERLKQVFKKVESHLHDIQEYWDKANMEQAKDSKKASFDPTVQIRNYLLLVNILEDAVLVIKKEKAEEIKRSDASG